MTDTKTDNQGHRFGRDSRVRKQSEFDRVFGEDAYAADNVLVLRGCKNGLEVSRLGLSISRRVGNAVVRNRWKRRIREAFRTQRDLLPVGYDFVARPRKGAQPDSEAIRAALPGLCKRVARKLNGKRA